MSEAQAAFECDARLDAPTDRPAIGASNGRDLFNRLLKWTPALWVLGALTLAQFGLLLHLGAKRWPKGLAVNLVVGGWFCVAFAQSCAAILNGIMQNLPMTGLRNAVSLSVIGWFLGGLAMAVGAAYRLNDAQTVRATSRLGLYIIALGGLALVLEQLTHQSYIILANTPVALITPASDIRTFYATAQLYLREETFGDTIVRLVLFFPWTTGLGLGGLGIFFISLLETQWRWRLAGLAGGLIGIVFSWSRVAQIAFLVGLALLFVLHLAGRWRILLICAAALALLSLPLAGIDPIEEVTHARSAVDGARAGSSLARELIYQRSWEGFLQSPVIGQGWIGLSVHPKEILPIGSHSTVYGTLYTGGLLTFGSFAVTMLCMAVGLIWRIATAPFGTPERAQANVGLVLLACLLLYSPVESLFSLTLPCCFVFTFIGAVLGRSPPPKPRPASATGRP